MYSIQARKQRSPGGTKYFCCKTAYPREQPIRELTYKEILFLLCLKIIEIPAWFPSAGVLDSGILK